MALISSLAALAAGLIFAVLAAALGMRLLAWARIEAARVSEHLLWSAGAGVITLQVMLFLLEFTGQTRRATVLAVLFLAALLGAAEVQSVVSGISEVVVQILDSPKTELSLAGTVCAVLLLQGLAAMAPLTGSDALHYHFTAPLLALERGFQPDFFLSHGFFSGQTHLLILAGLALGSEKLALALLFLGGPLSAAALHCLARRWMPPQWAWLVSLAFVLTPVVFWQTSGSGSPDIWMAFYTTLAVLVLARYAEERRLPLVILAGVLTGGVAGAKYTGCLVAACLLVALLWEGRSLRHASILAVSALAAGIWPYARNAAWTGDPVFPFLLRWMNLQSINSFTLGSYLADTGAGRPHALVHTLKFPFFASLDPSHIGLWEFFGPIILTFAPLLFIAVRNTPLWRVAGIVWIGSALAIGATSGMVRFLLPVFPLALAAVFSGLPELKTHGWRVAWLLCLATVAGFLLLGAAGLTLYERAPLAASMGITGREDYLRARAPDYQTAQFVNQVLAGNEGGGKALVFFRHVYYLRVPFLYGDPAASWAVDPARLQTPEQWQALFRAQGIRWLVRAPSYPPSIAEPLRQLEASGKLIPVAFREVSTFQGMRISGVRTQIPVVILRVTN
jgi:hypothetical protein